jgi:hypothetical protein
MEFHVDPGLSEVEDAKKRLEGLKVNCGEWRPDLSPGLPKVEKTAEPDMHLNRRDADLY